LLPRENTFNVKYLENAERFACATVIDKLFGFVVWLTVDQSKEDISDCKGLRDVAIESNFGQNKKSYEMAITSVVSDTSMQSLVLK